MWHNNIINPPKRCSFVIYENKIWHDGKIPQKVNRRSIFYTSPKLHFVRLTDNRANNIKMVAVYDDMEIHGVMVVKGGYSPNSVQLKDMGLCLI